MDKGGFCALTALVRAELKGGGKKFAQGGGDGLAVGCGTEDGGVGAGELEDGLSAGSAGHAGGAVEVDDGDGANADGRAVERDCGSDGGLLGAGSETVGGVFDVGAGDDDAGLIPVCVQEDGRADLEMAVGRVGVAGGFGGALMESVDLDGGKLGRHRRMSVIAESWEGKQGGASSPPRFRLDRCIQVARRCLQTHAFGALPDKD